MANQNQIPGSPAPNAIPQRSEKNPLGSVSLSGHSIQRGDEEAFAKCAAHRAALSNPSFVTQGQLGC